MKLRHFGIGASLPTVIASNLQNRVQQVRVGNYLSDELFITSGVPQGSVVGTLFFLIFINDLPDFCICTPFLFADDLKLAGSCMYTIQNDLLSLLTWSKNNKLDFNFKKTNLLNFSTTSVKCDHPVLFMENDIYLKNEKIRVLVVIVSPSLTWTSHAIQNLQIVTRGLQSRVYIFPALTYASGV